MFLVTTNFVMAADGSSTTSMSFVIIASVISLAALGVIFGGVLGVASKVFEVKTDPKVDEINNILPQIQCGMCGQAGCSAFAEALVKGDAEPNACGPGGPDVAQEIGRILGVEVGSLALPVARIMCTRNRDVKKNQEYTGIKDCRAAVTLNANIYECAYACLGFGTCAKVCSFGAIYMDDKDMPVVIEDKCTACTVCVTSCPVNIIHLTPRDSKVHVCCVSTEPPKIRAKVHKPGACIGCRKCVKKCPHDAIKMVDMVAVIDGEKCTNCKECVPVCPTEAIVVFPGLVEKPVKTEESSEEPVKDEDTKKDTSEKAEKKVEEKK